MNFKLDKYIAELLMEHNFVIVPGFGAFVTNYKKSALHPEEQKISPPSMELAFNSLIKSDDALLTHYIAEQEEITYTEAAQIIIVQLAEWKTELEVSGFIRINRIGEIRKNEDSKLIFQPYQTFNYFTESFGFRDVRLKPVQQRTLVLEERIYHELNKNSKLYKAKSAKTGNKRKIVFYGLALYLPVLIGMWVLFMTKEPFMGQQSSLNVFPSELNHSGMTDNKNADKNIPVQEIVEEKSVLNDSETLKERDIKHEIIESVEIQPEIMSVQSGFYYVIGGCFREYNNAIDFYDNLKKKEYFDSEILYEKNSFYKVSYGKFTSLHPARDFLNNIKLVENSSAWILNK